MSAGSPAPNNYPHSWRVTRLSKVAKFCNGREFTPAEPGGLAYPVYGSGGQFGWSNSWLHDGSSVLFGRKGTIDKPLLVKGKFWTVDTMFYTAINTSVVNPTFLYYWATRIPFDYYSTGTALPSMTQSDLGGEVIGIPPLPHQRRIADYLDHETAEINAFIHNLTHFRDLLTESLRSRRFQLFTSTDASETLRIKRVAKIGNGSGFPPTLQGNSSQEIPFYKVGSIRHSQNGSLVDSPDSISRETAHQIGATIFPPDTITMAKIGAALLLNRQALTTQASCLDNNMMGLIPNNLVSPRFLMHALANIDLTPLANPGAVPSLNVNWYRNLEIWVPSRVRQKTALDEYEAHRILIEATLSDISESTRLARERRAALITAAVTGRIDVTARNKPAAEQLEDDIAQGLHREN